MKRHEQLIIQERRSKNIIKKALRSAIRKLTKEQLKVFILYMKIEKNRTGYETCTPEKMRCQLTNIINVSLSHDNLCFSFHGSYGDGLSVALPPKFLDNAEGRKSGVDMMKRKINERADLKRERDIRELKVLAKRYPEILKEKQ